MRGIKTNINKSSEKKGESPSRGKRKSEREDDEDYEEFSRKKQKVPARKKQRAGVQQNPKSKGRYVRKEPPTYAAGSMEEQWYLEILSKGRVTCPTCRAVVRKTVEGLKKHMANCRQGDFVAGKYKCLLCEKEFISESGVKYHINSVHAEDWFDVNTTNKKSFEKLMKIRQREDEQRKQRKKCIAARSRKKRPGIVSAKKLLGAGAERSRRRSKRGHSQLVDNESRSSEEEEEEPQAAQRAETPKTIRKRGRK
ncbi:hypothetical protein KIL84_017434 [Mauremys mutica]|uniref:C2H2-type domain-containing protein n=1 Tax=Mauremys mutica TaxID=74926 RepID=A0A9D4AYN1_9SAUR|nr:hypothetical protein KIL84_017434 [Mauremys mutica]